MTEVTKRACVDLINVVRFSGKLEMMVLELGPQVVAKHLATALSVSLDSPGLPGTREECLQTIQELRSGEADQFRSSIGSLLNQATE